MSNKEKKQKSQVGLHIATPFIVLALCLGISAAAMIKPADKIKTYLNIAFMDDMKSGPADGSGLVITEDGIISDFSGETTSEGDVIRPSFGQQYAILSCDAFDADIPVYWGSETELLERGACQASSSVVIGTEGNAVISAHVDTFFADLEKLRPGDEVVLRTNYGIFRYSVKELISFTADNKEYIVPTEDTRLTLYTCRKELLGGSDQRVGVICEPTETSFYKLTDEEADS